MRKAIILFFLPVITFAQSVDPDTSSISTEKVEVVKNYEAVIQQARAKKIPVALPDEQKRPISYSYELKSEIKLDFERPTEIIRPVRYSTPRKPDPDIKDLSLYGSYGNYKTLSAGAAYHYYIEDWLDAGFRFDHFSADDTALPFQKYNTNDARFYASYFLTPKTKARVQLRYNNNNHYTEAPESDTVDIIRHKFEGYGGDFEIANSSFEKLGIAIRARASYDILKQKQDGTQESRFKLESNLYKKINDKISLELPLLYSNSKFESLLLNADFYDLIIAPSLDISLEKAELDAGIEFIRNDTSTFVFPLLDLELLDIYEGINLKLFTTSTYRRNSMFYLSEQNAFYRTDFSPLTAYYLRSYNINVNKNINDFILGMTFSFNDYTSDDMHMDDPESNRFIVSSIYREEWRLSPGLSYNTDQLHFDISYHYNIFTGATKDMLLYRPRTMLELNASQKLLNGKLIFGENLVYNSTRNITRSENNGELQSFVDLSLTADIILSKNIQVFARSSNLLASEYSIWFGHPVFERQIWAGLRINL